jgi:hypothetical protein
LPKGFATGGLWRKAAVRGIGAFARLRRKPNRDSRTVHRVIQVQEGAQLKYGVHSYGQSVREKGIQARTRPRSTGVCFRRSQAMRLSSCRIWRRRRLTRPGRITARRKGFAYELAPGCLSPHRLPRWRRFQRGLATARRQNARLFELRTATSLAQVWRDVGRVDDARTLLAPVYGRFTSGHNTVDLIQARAVLDGMR